MDTFDGYHESNETSLVGGENANLRVIRRELADLCATPGTHDELADILSGFFSKYGEVRKISSFNVNGQGGYFLIGFACDDAAVKAANSTGCSMFGFNSLLLSLEGLNGHA